MAVRKLLTLLIALLLVTAVSSQAQSGRAADPLPDPEYQEVKVRVTLPKAVSVVRDYGKILLARNTEKDKLTRIKHRLKSKTDKPVVDVTVDVPKNWITRKLGLVE